MPVGSSFPCRFHFEMETHSIDFESCGGGKEGRKRKSESETAKTSLVELDISMK